MKSHMWKPCDESRYVQGSVGKRLIECPVCGICIATRSDLGRGRRTELFELELARNGVPLDCDETAVMLIMDS